MNVKRQAIIKQSYCCAFCHKPFRVEDVICYNKRFGIVVCRPCNIPVVQLGSAIDRFGGTTAYFTMLNRFMAIVDKEPDDELADSGAQILTGTTEETQVPERPQL